MADANKSGSGELDGLVDNAATELFTPTVYVKKNGDIGASVKVAGAFGGISVETFLKIAKNFDSAYACAVKAAKLRKDPAVVKGLRDKASTKGGKAKPSVDGELDGLM